MKNNKFIKRLKSIADVLGYKVIFRRIKEMSDGAVGITCPETNRIYIDPNGDKDIASTIAHEIGHVILLYCSTPGHSSIYGDTNFDVRIAENAADEIGAALCRTIGCSHDFNDLEGKAGESLKAAKERYSNKTEYMAFLFGYCKALGDVLPSSEVGLGNIMKRLDAVFSGEIKYYRSRFPKRE